MRVNALTLAGALLILVAIGIVYGVMLSGGVR